MDFVNFQVEQRISLARNKGHKYYVYSLVFEIDEERHDGYIAIPSIDDFSSNSLEEAIDHSKDWKVRQCLNIEDKPKIIHIK